MIMGKPMPHVSFRPTAFSSVQFSCVLFCSVQFSCVQYSAVLIVFGTCHRFLRVCVVSSFVSSVQFSSFLPYLRLHCTGDGTEAAVTKPSVAASSCVAVLYGASASVWLYFTIREGEGVTALYCASASCTVCTVRVRARVCFCFP